MCFHMLHVLCFDLSGILCDKGHYYDAGTLHGALYTECDGAAKWNLTDAAVTDCWRKFLNNADLVTFRYFVGFLGKTVAIFLSLRFTAIQCETPPTVKNGTRTFGNSTNLPAKFNYTWEVMLRSFQPYYLPDYNRDKILCTNETTSVFLNQVSV